MSAWKRLLLIPWMLGFVTLFALSLFLAIPAWVITGKNLPHSLVESKLDPVHWYVERTM